MSFNKKDKYRTPVLYLDNTFTFGGAINSLLYLLRALVKSNFRPILVTAQPKAFLQDKFNFIEWYHIPLRLPWIHNQIYKKIVHFKPFRSGPPHVFISRIRFLYWAIFITLPEAFRYYIIGKKHKVRIVHLNNILGSQLAGILAAKFLGVPCVAHLRAFEEVSRATKYHAKLIDHHIAISEAIRQNILELDVPEAKITTIFDAIDLVDFNIAISCDYLKAEFNLTKTKSTFGIFGRIIDWKGIKEFVHAAALVIQSLPNNKALIVGDCSDGDNNYLTEVKELISQYGLEQDIILTGYRKDVPAIMGLMDVVVHASITPEPFGMVLIEGMAMGKPVVATKIGGPLDIVIDGQTGFLVKPSDVNEMAEAIHRLLCDKNLATVMGKNGKDRVATLFTKERYAIQVEEVYTNVLGLGVK